LLSEKCLKNLALSKTLAGQNIVEDRDNRPKESVKRNI
jgi:hypothetical protein